MERYLDILKLDWDVNTHTASDYTLEMRHTRCMYKHYRDRIYEGGEDQKKGLSLGSSFKLFIKKEIEDRLRKKHKADHIVRRF